jgi:hypothetical protein
MVFPRLRRLSGPLGGRIRERMTRTTHALTALLLVTSRAAAAPPAAADLLVRAPIRRIALPMK